MRLLIWLVRSFAFKSVPLSRTSASVWLCKEEFCSKRRTIDSASIAAVQINPQEKSVNTRTLPFVERVAIGEHWDLFECVEVNIETSATTGNIALQQSGILSGTLS